MSRVDGVSRCEHTRATTARWKVPLGLLHAVERQREPLEGCLVDEAVEGIDGGTDLLGQRRAKSEGQLGEPQAAPQQGELTLWVVESWELLQGLLDARDPSKHVVGAELVGANGRSEELEALAIEEGGPAEAVPEIVWTVAKDLALGVVDPQSDLRDFFLHDGPRSCQLIRGADQSTIVEVPDGERVGVEFRAKPPAARTEGQSEEQGGQRIALLHTQLAPKREDSSVARQDCGLGVAKAEPLLQHRKVLLELSKDGLSGDLVEGVGNVDLEGHLLVEVEVPKREADRLNGGLGSSLDTNSHLADPREENVGLFLQGVAANLRNKAPEDFTDGDGPHTAVLFSNRKKKSACQPRAEGIGGKALGKVRGNLCKGFGDATPLIPRGDRDGIVEMLHPHAGGSGRGTFWKAGESPRNVAGLKR